MGEEEDPDPWNGDAVRLKQFDDEDKATTVNHVMARLEQQRTSESVQPENNQAAPVESVVEHETDAFCVQLRRALDRVRAYEEADGPQPADAEGGLRDDEGEMPVEPRRRRRTRAPRRPSASPVPSSSSSDSVVGHQHQRHHHVGPRTQHEISHARSDRLQRQRVRPSKVDAAIARRQRSLNRPSKPSHELEVNTETLEAHVRQRAYSLDGNPGWTLPLPRRPSNAEFVVKRYNAFYEDETDLPAPAVNWETLRMAREKCTEWLVKHVLLPDPQPRTRNPKPRVT